MDDNIKYLFDELRNLSLQTFRDHSDKASIDFVADVPLEGKSWRAVIFIGGDGFQSMFAVNFNTISLLGMASKCFADVAEASYSKYVKDFMREYCNQVAGKIKAAFEKKGMAYISLPMISREYDAQTLFNNDNLSHDTWSFGEHTSAVKIDFYFSATQDFSDFDFVKEHFSNKESTQEIEFF